MSTLQNRQFKLASRPVGMVQRSDFDFVTTPAGEPGPGDVLVKVLELSLDPAMRGWMNEGKSYIAPVGIGEVMRAGGIGKVIASKNPQFAEGDHVSCMTGVQDYCLAAANEIKPRGLHKIDLRVGTPAQWL